VIPMKKVFLLTLIMLCANSCDRAAYSASQDRFEQNRWYASEPVTLEIQVQEDGQYDVEMEFGHVYQGIPVKSIPMELIIRRGEQALHTATTDYQILDQAGAQIGDCVGDLCDSRQLLAQEIKFEKGTYTFVITQQFDHEFLPNVVRMGIRLKRAGQ
jgi:gliding motility-associated lipoprotein GldH